MVWLWVLILAAIVLFMYVWPGKTGLFGGAPAAPGCNACSKRKNVPAVE